MSQEKPELGDVFYFEDFSDHRPYLIVVVRFLGNEYYGNAIISAGKYEGETGGIPVMGAWKDHSTDANNLKKSIDQFSGRWVGNITKNTKL